MTGKNSDMSATEIKVGVADGDWFDEDPRWNRQRLELFAAIRDASGASTRPAADSGKGTAETVIVALGSAGAFTAVIEIFKAWIGTRKNRKITVTRVSDGTTLVLTMDNVSEDEARRWLERPPE
ncbi:effector-associated constant component EACC1 [Actinoplanes sp. URMC 104]|uniref:effector-associated constant component EACC1 n=1 Tax=Actinoplanes sp. URMC 104 TaxID=3423409 RepID=UPI003F1CBCA0